MIHKQWDKLFITSVGQRYKIFYYACIVNLKMPAILTELYNFQSFELFLHFCKAKVNKAKTVTYLCVFFSLYGLSYPNNQD